MRLPLLPGHGTEWQQMQLTRWPDWYGCRRTRAALAGAELRAGLRHGSVDGRARLTLRLALEHPDLVDGIAIVNASVHSHNRALQGPAAAATRGSDGSRRRATTSRGRDRTSSRTTASPSRPCTRSPSCGTTSLPDSTEISCPVLAFGSDDDHVVEPSNSVRDRAGGELDRRHVHPAARQLPRGDARQRRPADPRAEPGLRGARGRASPRAGAGQHRSGVGRSADS